MGSPFYSNHNIHVLERLLNFVVKLSRLVPIAMPSVRYGQTKAEARVGCDIVLMAASKDAEAVSNQSDILFVGCVESTCLNKNKM